MTITSQLLDTLLYDRGSSYVGDAIIEKDHYEFLKVYSQEDSQSAIVTSTETASSQQGYELLKIVIHYDASFAYHVFDVDVYYIPSQQQMSMNTNGVPVVPIQGMFAWAMVVPLINAITGILAVLLAAYVIISVKGYIDNVSYGSPGSGTNGSGGLFGSGVSTNMVLLGVVGLVLLSRV